MYGNWQLIDFATGTSWTDPDVIIGPPMTTWFWKIRAEDWSGKKSTYSNEVSAIGMIKPVVHNPEEPNKIPESFNLSQNYPNPFNPVTNITFDLPVGSFVILTVYNIHGQTMATLINNYLEAGSYIAQFDATNFSSGVYFYKISAVAFHEIHRMLVIK